MVNQEGLVAIAVRGEIVLGLHTCQENYQDKPNILAVATKGEPFPLSSCLNCCTWPVSDQRCLTSPSLWDCHVLSPSILIPPAKWLCHILSPRVLVWVTSKQVSFALGLFISLSWVARNQMFQDPQDHLF